VRPRKTSQIEQTHPSTQWKKHYTYDNNPVQAYTKTHTHTYMIKETFFSKEKTLNENLFRQLAPCTDTCSRLSICTQISV